MNGSAFILSIGLGLNKRFRVCLDPVLSGFSLHHHAFFVVAFVPEFGVWAFLYLSLYLRCLASDFSSFGE